MMKRNIVAAVTAALMCAAAGTSAFAQDSEGKDGRYHGRGAGHRMQHDEFGDPARMLEMMTRHLDLDATQSQKISNILEAAGPQIDALRERGQATRTTMHELNVDDPDYGVKLQQLSMEIGELTSEVTLLHGTVRADVFAVLTAEQRELAAEGRRGKRGHFRHGGFFRKHGSESELSQTE